MPLPQITDARPGAFARLVERVTLCAALIALASAPGCGDLTNSHALVELTAPETVPALRFQAELPSLPALARGRGSALPLDPLVDEWERSWREPMPMERGRALRARVNRTAADLLAADVRDVEVAERIEDLGHTLGSVAALAGGDLPPQLAMPVERARTAHRRASVALERDDRHDALVHLMLAADALWEVTPERLTWWLLAQAEEELRRTGEATSYTEETRHRAERLVAGARTALDDESPARALQRAWYAVQLLGAPDGR